MAYVISCDTRTGKTGVSDFLSGWVVPVEVGACVSCLHEDRINLAEVRRPVESLAIEVGDGHGQVCIENGAIIDRRIHLEFDPGLT